MGIRKHLILVILLFLLLACLVFAGCGSSATTTDTTPAGTIPQSQPVQKKTVDDFFSINNIKEADQLVVGPSIISGTAKCDGFTLTLNDQPVGIPADTKNFLPTYNIIEGRNLLKFVATDGTGQTYDKLITVVGIQPAPPPQPAPQAQPSTPGRTVYITNTGGKYHSAGCQYLRQSQIPISLSDAIARGYSP